MIILVVVLLFFDQTSSLAAGCGTTLYQQSGTLSLPSDSILSCQWRIVAGESEKIVLNVRDLNIVKSRGCEVGSLEVYDGFWDTSPLLGRFCGSGPLNLLLSSSNKMLVNYVNPNQGGTFMATYESVCGGALFLQNSTTLKYHESGITYPNSKKCVWFIIVPDEYQVRLDFTKFRLEYEQNCLYDYVEIVDGLTQNVTVGKFCGTEVPPPIYSSSSSLQIKFVSDHSVNDEGFEVDISLHRDYCGGTHGCAHYCNNTMSGYTCTCRSGYQLLPDGKNCALICGGTLNAPYGSIEFSSHFGAPTRCVWDISVPVGHDITVEFFSCTETLSCGTQSLEIFSGTGSSAVHETLCGVLPTDLKTYQSNILKIVFTSNSNAGAEFSLNYASFPNSCGPHNGNCRHQCRDHKCLCQAGYELQPNNLDCKLGLCNYEISALSGEVTSPGYPGNYANKLNCTWSFRTTPGHTLAINFLLIDLEPHTTCHYDYIKLFDGPSSGSTVLSQLCGRNKINGTLVRSGSNEVYMIFKSDVSNTGLGFRANYSSVCGGNWTADNVENYIFSHDRYLVSDYYNNMNCSWNILPKLGHRTKLTIETFHLEWNEYCVYDFVEIFEDGRALGKFCGVNIPHEFESQGLLTIRFKTDGSAARRGFQIKYQAV